MYTFAQLYAATIFFIDYYLTRVSLQLQRFVPSSIPLIEECCYKIFFDIISWIWLLIDSALHVIYLLGCICSLVLFVSFCKSLQSRYYVYSDEARINYEDNEEENRANERSDDSSKEKAVARSVRSPLREHILPLIENTTLDSIPLIGYYLKSGIQSERDIKQCIESLTDANIRSVYKQISWSHTNFDIESVQWFNKILKTFWPCIKVTLNKLLFNDLLKPKRNISMKIPKVSKDLSKKRTKLSIFISGRRRLIELYKQKRKENQLTGKILNILSRGILTILIYTIKLFSIYTKQFVMDIISSLAKSKSNSNNESSGRKLNILQSVLAEDSDRLTDRSSISSGNTLDNHDGQIEFSKSISIPSRRVVIERRGTYGPRIICRPHGQSIDKFRENRIKLARVFLNQAISEARAKDKEFVIEKINLGDAIPTINCIKHIDDNNDRNYRDIIGEPLSDASDMKFLIELSYQTDSNFNVQMNSVPVLEHVKLSKLSLQLRLMITVNHTTTELNRNLEIMDTPGDVLFPAVNHVQVTLVDVPRVDWQLIRPSISMFIRKERSIRSHKNKILFLIEEYLDPIHLLNSIYIKYLVNMVIYLTLKWFKPFDIKIGNYLFMKTIC